MRMEMPLWANPMIHSTSELTPRAVFICIIKLGNPTTSRVGAGLDLSSVGAFSFVRGVLKHRKPGQPLTKVFGLKIK
jgi:hypothetical protein